MGVTPEEKKRVKGMGFLSNRDSELFSARVITENGVLNARQLKNLSEAAEKYGNGNIAFTSRLTVELQGIPYDDIENLQAYLKKDGMVTGGTGNKVRPVTACKGTVCVFGLIDTQGLATEIHKRFFEGYAGVVLPHKFKIAVGGCPNNCMKPDLNDIGIVGQHLVDYNTEACRGCKKCGPQEACPMNALSLADGKLTVDQEKCNNCGRCVGTCYFDSCAPGTTGYKIYLGGRWGKSTRIGTPLRKIANQEEALDIIEKAILLFKQQGKPGERFSTVIERLGLEQTEKLLVSDELLLQKDEILQRGI